MYLASLVKRALHCHQIHIFDIFLMTNRHVEKSGKMKGYKTTEVQNTFNNNFGSEKFTYPNHFPVSLHVFFMNLCDVIFDYKNVVLITSKYISQWRNPVLEGPLTIN